MTSVGMRTRLLFFTPHPHWAQLGHKTRHFESITYENDENSANRINGLRAG